MDEETLSNLTIDSAVLALIKVGEFRESPNHLKRIGAYSALLAQQLGYSQSFCDLIYQASQLHDLGKMGIPLEILDKPGKLNEAEFEVIKTHIKIGGDIIGSIIQGGLDIDVMKMAQDIAYFHHEKWDGSGYNCGYSGEKIPLAARIIAVADIYDSFRSERVYKPAWSQETTLPLMRDHSGKHFDPSIVDAFMVLAPTFASINDKYQDKK
ncbi:MAG: HD domain-containing phosphohydrolase [Nanoarchaeota archaeon]